MWRYREKRDQSPSFSHTTTRCENYMSTLPWLFQLSLLSSAGVPALMAYGWGLSACGLSRGWSVVNTHRQCWIKTKLGLILRCEQCLFLLACTCSAFDTHREWALKPTLCVLTRAYFVILSLRFCSYVYLFIFINLLYLFIFANSSVNTDEYFQEWA